jgi:hypothetical protein
MDLIGSSLTRLRAAVDDFATPSNSACDLRVLKMQIDLRQRALAEIEIIRCRLRPFIGVRNSRRRLRFQAGRRGLPAFFRTGR